MARLAGAGCASLMALAGLAAQPASDDPLRSPECQRARTELDGALAAPDAAGGPRLQRARAAALHACLGAEADTRQRSGAPDPPRVVPPTLPPAVPARAPTPAPVVVLPAPTPVPPRATTITTCDPAGCWDSEGRRLNQMGPLLVGPRGPCIGTPGAVTCPWILVKSGLSYSAALALVAQSPLRNEEQFMGNKIVTEADRKRSAAPKAIQGYTPPRSGGGQRISLERGVATPNKKNPGKRAHQGG